MGYAEKRKDKYGEYYRGRFKKPDGRYGTVADTAGGTRRFDTKRAAVKAANDEEAKIRAKKWKDPAAGQTTFGEYASQWYAAQDLAASTMANYRRRLEQHLLPTFEDMALGDILPTTVDTWERAEREAGYEEGSIRSWRMLLHTILADAVTAGLIDHNPVTRKRNRGKRAGRSMNRAPEKVITNPLGALLIAERAALLSGRDDEFVMLTTKYWTGMRWGEITGLETQYARRNAIRVEWQLCEIDGGQLVRCPPKDDSYRDVDLPAFLSTLIADHISRTAPQPCGCHGQTYVFRGQGERARTVRKASIADVARQAGVSVGTVSNVLNHPDRVVETKRAAVEEAAASLGFRPGGGPVRGGHWRRSGFSAWVFTPAVSGWFPSKGELQPAHPVPLAAEPFPGRPLRGRGAQERATASWVPIARGLTPHGLKHSAKTLMAELRTPEVLSHERLGHEMGGIGAVYSHVTPAMRAELCEQLTALWTEAVDIRRSMSPGSPVAVLDGILRAKKKGDDPMIVSPDSPRGRVLPAHLRSREGQYVR
ncbi:LacI family DNA-binding transcriptional regulator [Actinomadura sp. WMMA1423]|uniref:LacI family DNA-binding transcriptional regulator n=1 Tax=Actinomadura sp. WMMA1423 TaxID=2591108 RepID=UPI0011474F34|nr:LacI family DNA-binding transcriptional regulator [Actinomadura sp. WMMA1423]